MRVTHHILFRWVFALTLSAIVLLPSQALVVCVGEHGHAAIEWVHEDSGCDHNHISEVAPGQSFVMGHCHDTCRDTSLPGLLATRSCLKIQQACAELSMPPVLFVIAWEHVLPAVSASLVSDIPTDQQVGRVLSSTVLLI